MLDDVAVALKNASDMLCQYLTLRAQSVGVVVLMLALTDYVRVSVPSADAVQAGAVKTPRIVVDGLNDSKVRSLVALAATLRAMACSRA